MVTLLTNQVCLTDNDWIKVVPILVLQVLNFNETCDRAVIFKIVSLSNVL